MKSGLPQYRCQRCGNLAFNADGDHLTIDQLSIFCQNVAITAVASVPRMTVHPCPDGAVGLAVIVGLMTPEQLQEWKKQVELAKATPTPTPEKKPDAN